MDRDEFVSAVEDLKRTPARLRELLARVPPERENVRPAPDAFSARENVHHLRDLEAEGYGVRLLRLLDERDPLLPDIDGEALARERNYSGRQYAGALEEFARLRAANVERLQRLTDEELERGGTMQNVGAVTIAKLVELWRDHDRGHLDEIARLVS